LAHTGLFWHIQVSFQSRLTETYERNTLTVLTFVGLFWRIQVSFDTYRSLLSPVWQRHTKETHSLSWRLWVFFDTYRSLLGQISTKTYERNDHYLDLIFVADVRQNMSKETTATHCNTPATHWNTLQHTATHKYGIALYYSVNSNWFHKYLSAAPNCRQTCMHKKTFTQNQIPLGTLDYTHILFSCFVFPSPPFLTLLVCCAVPQYTGAALPFKDGAWQVRLHIFHFFFCFQFFYPTCVCCSATYRGWTAI